jgi:hypothetical protein
VGCIQTHLKTKLFSVHSAAKKRKPTQRNATPTTSRTAQSSARRADTIRAVERGFHIYAASRRRALARKFGCTS